MQGGMGGDYQGQMMNYYVSLYLTHRNLSLTIDISPFKGGTKRA